jgi:hypothetical protein
MALYVGPDVSLKTTSICGAAEPLLRNLPQKRTFGGLRQMGEMGHEPAR